MRKLRTITIIFSVSLGIFSLAVAGLHAADTSSGSGAVIGSQGEILTNAHVVEGCVAITVRFSTGNSEAAVLVARDEKNDLAVIRSKTFISSVAAFRDGAPLRAGDTVVALGYPLSGLLATNANLSVGNVSALAGLGDDSRYVQISAPVQPGNSGGPLLDDNGHLVGIVTAKLNAVRIAKFTGDIPQNVNFALKGEVVRTFLDSKGMAYRKAPSDQHLSPADVGDIARPFTVHLQCEAAPSQVAVADQLGPLFPHPKNAPKPHKPWPDQLPPDPVSSLPRSNLTIDTRRGAQRFIVQLALTKEQWAWGLRHPVPNNAGMLYVYHPYSRSVAHSMKEIPISLDVLFIDGRGRIVGIIERRLAMSQDTIESKAPVMAMLELNGGAVKQFHIKIGDVVRVAAFSEIFSMDAPK
jgi:uncharacterized membrane protein (UPF0127 family)